MDHSSNSSHSGRVSRRSLLADTGMGFTGVALGAMLFRDGVARADSTHIGPQSGPHLPQRAKSVIWIFLCGGVSHLETFDFIPELNKYGGKSIEDTPYKEFLDEKRINKNLVGLNPGHMQRKLLMPLQTGFKKYGQCGLEVGDWFQHIGECADDLAVVPTERDPAIQLANWRAGDVSPQKLASGGRESPGSCAPPSAPRFVRGANNDYAEPTTTMPGRHAGFPPEYGSCS